MAREPSAARAVSSKAARTVSRAADHILGFELQCAAAVDNRLDAAFGRDLHLRRQIGQIDTARGLPGAVEIVVDQFAALALAKHLGKPVGGRRSDG